MKNAVFQGKYANHQEILTLKIVCTLAIYYIVSITSKWFLDIARIWSKCLQFSYGKFNKKPEPIISIFFSIDLKLQVIKKGYR